MTDLPITLAREAPFRLGTLQVTPSLREVAAPDGTRQTLEPRVMQVLVALQRAEGATVSRDELIRTCWNGTVVGEGSINRTISLLRRVSDGIGGGAFRIETIAKVGYRLVLSSGDAAPSVLAGEAAPWVGSRSGARGLAWVGLTTVAIVAAVALALWQAAPSGPTYSVNVEPFRLSAGAQGFDEELLSTLTSQNVPMAAGRIPLTLTGSVEERDGAVRVNARLADPASDQVVWSGAITRRLAGRDGLAGVAAVIGSVAQCTLAGANDAGGTVPLDVLSGYARTCELGYRGQSDQGVRAARELTQRAPDFAPGWFALSYHAITRYFRQPQEDPQLQAEALAAADKLIALRPNAQDGYASKFVAMDPRPSVERERLLLRAVQLEPIYADVAQGHLSAFLMQVGRGEEAFQLRWTAAQQMPDAPAAFAQLVPAAAETGRWPIVERAIERVRQLDPAALPPLLWRQAVWAQDWAAAERYMPIEHPLQEQAARSAYRALAAGDRASKQAAARQLRTIPPDCCMRLRIELLTLLGYPAEAIALLDAYSTAHTPDARRGLQFLSDPALRPLWYDPAIEGFFSRNGWIAYWRASRTRPDFCGQENAPRFCRLLAA